MDQTVLGRVSPAMGGDEFLLGWVASVPFYGQMASLAGGQLAANRTTTDLFGVAGSNQG